MRAGLVLGLFTALASCAVDEEITSSVNEEINTCGAWLCGGNSPVIEGIGDFYELNVNGLENAKHLKVLGFVQNGFVWAPSVVGGKFIATRTSGGTTFTLTGMQLKLGRLWLQQTTTGKLFQLQFTDVVQVDMWARLSTGAKPKLEAYVLDYFAFINGGWGDPKTLCSNAPERGNPDLLNMNQFATVFFEGDLIDARHKVETGVDNSWFNLGCAGHTLAKMALTGHTVAAANAGLFSTTQDERTTMLKLLTADYCGDGTPWTVTGQQLRWHDDHNTMFYNDPTLFPNVNLGNAVLETRWTPHGAHCLVTPRVDENPTPLAKFVYGDPPNLYPQITGTTTSACTIPVCSDQDFSLDGFHLVTVTPQP